MLLKTQRTQRTQTSLEQSQTPLHLPPLQTCSIKTVTQTHLPLLQLQTLRILQTRRMLSEILSLKMQLILRIPKLPKIIREIQICLTKLKKIPQRQLTLQQPAIFFKETKPRERKEPRVSREPQAQIPIFLETTSKIKATRRTTLALPKPIQLAPTQQCSTILPATIPPKTTSKVYLFLFRRILKIESDYWRVDSIVQAHFHHFLRRPQALGREHSQLFGRARGKLEDRSKLCGGGEDDRQQQRPSIKNS